jgi:uncharacterized membrane protein YfcA
MQIEARPEITRAPVTAVVIGLAAGMFSALLGVGGGLLMVPAMVSMLRIRQHRAHGTSLIVIVPTALAGVYAYAQHLSVRWDLALLLAVGGVLGAMLGARMASALKARHLQRAFGVFVIVAGIWMIAAPASLGESPHASLLPNGSRWPVTLLVGILAGSLSGMLGVGGGIVMIPAVVYLLGQPQKMAQAISLAVIIPVALSGGLIHYLKGNVIPHLAGWLACGAVVGATVVGNLVGKIADATLHLVFGIFLIAVGVSTVTRHRREDGMRR